MITHIHDSAYLSLIGLNVWKKYSAAALLIRFRTKPIFCVVANCIQFLSQVGPRYQGKKL